jgi:hypothetical protein
MMRNWLALLGCCGFIAWAEPVPRTFFCSFDGTVSPAEATGSGMAMPDTEVYVPGRTGQGLAVREPDHAVYYLAGPNLPKDRGAISLWIQPLWEPGDQERRGFLCDDMPNAKAGVNTIWLWKIGNALRFDVRDPQDSYITTSLADWRQGEWYHIVANWDCEKGTELYVNGTQVGARECTWIPRFGFRFAVGKRQRTTEAADAVINDLAIYARPLTADEVELARAGNLPTVPQPRPAPQAAAAQREPQLLFHVPFDGSPAASHAGGAAEPDEAEGISYAPGAMGEAAVFTRQSKLTFPQPGNLNQAAGTISLWYKPSWELGIPGPEVWRCLFQQGPYPKDRVGSNMIWFWLWSERVRFDVSDTKDSYARHNLGQWDTRRWHHLVATWDYQQGTRIYLDGEPTGVSGDSGSAVLPSTWTVFDNFSLFHVGCSANGQGAEGMIDDFRIYDGALDAEAVRAEYARVFPLTVEFAKPGPPYLRIGEKAELAWQVRLADREPFRGDVSWRLLGPDDQPLGPGETLHLDLAGDAKRQTVLTFAPTVPGKYTVEVSYPAGGGNQVERLACYVIPPEPDTPRPDEIQTELLERIDLTAALPPDRYVETGDSRVMESPLGRYRETGDAHRSRLAVRVALPEADAAYVLEVDYPDDKPRTMEVLAQPAASGGGYELQSGVYCGDEYPLSNRMLTHRCVFWARSTDMAFLLMTAEENRPAAASEMRLYRVVGRLPNRLGTASGGRQIGIYYEDPALCYDFGGHETMPAFAKTIDRLMEYMEWSGQDLFMYPGVWYHGPLYPSRSQNLAMSRTHPDNFIGYVLTRFEERGLSFAPTLNVHNLSSLATHKCTEDLLLSGNLPQSALMIYRDGMPNMGGWHGTPPNFNPLHPEVRQAILTMIDEMLELYGDSPAFRGICFHLPMHVMLWFGHADAGYNDYCIEAFERETGISIPVAADDPSRVRLRAQWLQNNAWDAWISWRCRAIHGLYTEIANHIAAKRPDLKLIINTFRPSITDAKQYADYMQPGHVLRVNREAGFDPALYADNPNIVIQQTIYPADYRWSRAHGRKDNVERFRQRHFQAETFTPLINQPNAWVHMHDRYWEDAVGRSKPLVADWLKESGWRVSTLNPTPPQFLQHYLAPLRFGDVQTITKGGFLVGTLGVEDELARFSRAFRALPAVPFADVASPGEVRVRAATHDGALYFYAANTGNNPATVRIRIDGQPTAVTELGEGNALTPTLEIPLSPYSLRSFRADGQNLSMKAE